MMLPALNFDESEGGDHSIWEGSKKVALPPLGRVLNTIFNADCRDVERAVSSDNMRVQQGSVGRAVMGLLQHVERLLPIGISLDQIHIPMLEHAVKSKDLSKRRKIVCLLRWLFTKTKFVVLLAKSLAVVAGNPQGDHRMKLGWCVVVRELVEKESLLYQIPLSVQTEKELMQSAAPLMSFRTCVPYLVQIMCTESFKDGKQEVPTRLTMAAADCTITITKSLVSDPLPKENEAVKEKKVGKEDTLFIAPTSSRTIDNNVGREADHFDDDEGLASTSGREPQVSFKDQGEVALWDNLDDIVLLVSKLREWNERGRPLHARGLQQVQKRLAFLAKFRDSLKSQDGGNEDIAVGVSVLAACWRQFSSLILLEDRTLLSVPKPVVEHWLGALQYWTQAAQELDAAESRRADEMRGYALTCLALVLGRLDSQRVEVALADLEPQLLQTLMNQIRGGDNENIDISMSILRALLFRSSLSPIEGDIIAASGVSSKMEDIVPVLMDMLDARDSAARAVVLLVAEFFALNPTSPELEKVFVRLDSQDPLQRRNGLDVLTELLAITTNSVDTVDSPLSRTIATHLFDRLGDEELSNRVEASALFAKLDPSFTLAPLVYLVYSPDARKRSAASSAVTAVLNGHCNQSHTITVLLDCLCDLMAKSTTAYQSDAKASAGSSTKEGVSLDLDRVLRLIPAWASKVKDWEPLIGVLLEKMYNEASNPIIPRFLSHISDQLSSMPQLVLSQVCQRMHEQPKMSEELLSKLSQDEDALGQLLFQRLSPMLVLRVLPLKAFNDSNIKELYGLSRDVEDHDITTLLLDRMCGVWELDDVRKIAAELTGRLLPDVMLPLVSAALEEAASSSNTVTAKACLFALCTSLMIRGRQTLDHPVLKHVQKSLSMILLWSEGSKEIAKAQHGCIDCFAAMICAEVGTVGTAKQPSSISNHGDQKMKKLIEEIPDGNSRSRPRDRHGHQNQWKVLLSVISCVTGQQPGVPFSGLLRPSQDDEGAQDIQLAPEMFRVCMANVLISASQKISPSARPIYAQTVIPSIMHFIQISSASKLRRACLQVLFTSVYHLKGPAMIPFVSDLLNLSISTINGRHSPEERIAGTKLLASLLASEEDVLREIAPYLEDARRAVATVSNMDSSPQLRVLCEQLLACMTTST